MATKVASGKLADVAGEKIGLLSGGSQAGSVKGADSDADAPVKVVYERHDPGCSWFCVVLYLLMGILTIAASSYGTFLWFSGEAYVRHPQLLMFANPPPRPPNTKPPPRAPRSRPPRLPPLLPARLRLPRGLRVLRRRPQEQPVSSITRSARRRRGSLRVHLASRSQFCAIAGWWTADYDLCEVGVREVRHHGV